TEPRALTAGPSGRSAGRCHHRPLLTRNKHRERQPTPAAVNAPTGGPATSTTPSPALAPGDTVTCAADTPHTVTEADVNAGHVSDSATATGTGVRGGESPPSKPFTATIPAATVVAVSLDKLAIVDPIGYQPGPTVGDTV